ncbi:MAG TPA: cytochrome b N-terminal domain-containing protein [Terriglobales bacterium]|nr:cytochrome b N-terminal domain-containing protein [Terriglobales bacterium]
MAKLSITKRIWNWFVERANIQPILTPRITERALTPMYCLGGLTFLFFVLLVITGMMLAMYYKPTTAGAYDSVQEISTVVRYGWLIRGVHFYAANGMLIAAILHMLRVYFTGAYKKPRELNWVVGVGLGALTLMAGFTGYVLRWDQEAVGAQGIGLGLASAIPGLGNTITSVFWGDYDQTIGHFFIGHVLLIPAVLILLMAFHFYMIRSHGIAKPL